MAFPFAEGTEILAEVRASLLEEPASEVCSKPGAGPRGWGWRISGASVTCRSQEGRTCTVCNGARGHAYTHTPLKAEKIGTLTLAGLLGFLWAGGGFVPREGIGACEAGGSGWIQLRGCFKAPGPGAKVWGAGLGGKRGFHISDSFYGSSQDLGLKGRRLWEQ